MPDFVVTQTMKEYVTYAKQQERKRIRRNLFVIAACVVAGWICWGWMG